MVRAKSVTCLLLACALLLPRSLPAAVGQLEGRIGTAAVVTLLDDLGPAGLCDPRSAPGAPALTDSEATARSCTAAPSARANHLRAHTSRGVQSASSQPAAAEKLRRFLSCFGTCLPPPSRA